jgi:2,3-bisphosphoglycerate-dependent phosphoglycerate mutase
MPLERLILVRHGQSTYNARGLVNGDPTVAVTLDAVGREQCQAVGRQIARFAIDLGVHTRFPRTIESLGIILGGRDVPTDVVPELDDVRLGDFESRPIEEYRAWKRAHGPDVPPPGEGEDRLEALYRYVAGFQRLLDVEAPTVLAVIHDVPIRFLANGMMGADPLAGPVARVANAEVRDLTADMVRRGIASMRDRLGG